MPETAAVGDADTGSAAGVGSGYRVSVQAVPVMVRFCVAGCFLRC